MSDHMDNEGSGRENEGVANESTDDDIEAIRKALEARGGEERSEAAHLRVVDAAKGKWGK